MAAGFNYDPHRPWLLVGYRPGGGRPKSVAPYATQAEAAAALRYEIAHEDAMRPGERYAFIIRHVTGKMSLWWALQPIDRVEQRRLATLQARVSQSRMASRRRTRARKKRISDMSLQDARAAQRKLEADFHASYRGNGLHKASYHRHWRKYEEHIKALRGSRHGNAELQTGKFYSYKGHRVWLDAVPGGYFAMVEGTALQARGTTQGEALKRLREKLDKGAANYRRGRRHGNAEASGYRVAYLVRARRTLHDGAYSRDAAIRLMKAYKRRGMTAWVEDSAGGFVSVPGAMRQPKHANRRKGKR